MIGHIGPNNAADCYFVGKIQAIRISSGERYTSSFTPARKLAKDDSTVLLYTPAKLKGKKVIDQSGHGNDGEIERR